MSEILRIASLRLNRGSREVLRGVDISVNRGELLALMGLSGGGKTTILRSVAALETFNDGSITVDGVTLRPGPLPQRSRRFELSARHRFQRAAIDLALVRRVVEAESQQRRDERRKLHNGGKTEIQHEEL